MSARGVKPGDVLGGKYRVERILGAGGMGIVVAAMHIDLGQRVALKFMLKEAMQDSQQAERFLREAKAAVQLKSVHTAKVIDVGRLKNDEPFMVMEYLDGRDLDAELHAHGPFPPHTAVDFILQASEALAEAHGLGMIHRDVKLKNIFLTKTLDGRPLVKVLDFGLAKRLGSHGDVSLTATNSVFGSPQYMSPEQMKSAKDVDYRSDIWSLGVCLYELVTGRLPFDASGVAEICAMVLKDPVPPPSQFAFGLPGDLEDVILKCLEKDATLRYQSVAEVAFALQNYAADQGSARRILQVMESASKIDHPTFLTSPGAVLDGPKTLNAWDSGSPVTRRTTQILTRPQIIGALVGSVFLGLIGAGAIIISVKQPRHTLAAPSADMTGTETALALPPPSATDPVGTGVAPTGTVIGSSPDPTDTAPTAPPPIATTEGHAKKPPSPSRPNTTATHPPVATPKTPLPPPPPVKSAKPPGARPGNGAEYM